MQNTLQTKMKMINDIRNRQTTGNTKNTARKKNSRENARD